MSAQAILRALAERNGGPGLTADELTARLDLHRANVRNDLATLVFQRREVTCDREGRYRIGSPDALLEVRA